MIITCPQCSAQYRYDEARFGEAKKRKVKCPKCSAVFEILNPVHDMGESTYIGRRMPKQEKSPEHQTDQIKLVESENPELPALPPLPSDIRFSLAVIAGTQAGAVFKINKPRIYLGRGTAVDIRLADGEASRRHAMIEIRGEKVTLVDLGATNGTFVEGERIDRYDLSNQSEFTLGSTTLMLIVTETSDRGM